MAHLFDMLATVNPWWLIGGGVALLPVALVRPLARLWRARGGFPASVTQRVRRGALQGAHGSRRGEEPPQRTTGHGHTGLHSGPGRAGLHAGSGALSLPPDSTVPPDSGATPLRRGVRGSLADLSLATLLGALEAERRTGVLRVAAPHAAGTVVWRRGRLVRATYAVQGAEDGEAALRALLRLPGGTFHFTPQDVPGDAELGVDVQVVLMGAAQAADEA